MIMSNENTNKSKDTSPSKSQSLRSSYSSLQDKSNKMIKQTDLWEKTKILKERISLSLTRNATSTKNSVKKNSIKSSNERESSTSNIFMNKNKCSSFNSQSSIPSTGSNSYNDSNDSCQIINNSKNNNNKKIHKINYDNVDTISIKTRLKIDHINSLNKCLNEFIKSVNYFEQVIKNKKIEIISSSVTAILESIIELYNITQNFNFLQMKSKDNNMTINSEYNRNEENNKAAISMYKSNINESLANLLKWSDKFFYSANCEINLNDVDYIIKDLDNCIKNFITHYKNYYFRMYKLKRERIKKHNNYFASKSLSPFLYRSSCSRSSSLLQSDKNSKLNSYREAAPQKNSGKQKKTGNTESKNLKNHCNNKIQDDNKFIEQIHSSDNKSKIKLQSISKNKQENQSGSTINDICIFPKELKNSASQLNNDASEKSSILKNLDKLALELSELSSSNSSFNKNNKYFDDELCTKLIPRFETIIKEFNKKEKSNDYEPYMPGN